MKKRELELEAKVIELFILKAKKERYLSFIQKKKSRKKFLEDFSHMNFLNKELFEKVGGDEHEMIRNRIRKIGDLKDCYVISENRDIDGRRLEIKSALKETIGADLGTLLVFGDAEIVYAEAEGFNNRWISK
ncbi:MAG: hypothetical protein WA960_00345 [Tunicatimonas sp.]